MSQYRVEGHSDEAEISHVCDARSEEEARADFEEAHPGATIDRVERLVEA